LFFALGFTASEHCNGNDGSCWVRKAET